MSVGKVREFDIKTGNWSAYVDRIEMYFVANKITEELKLPTLIALIGDQAYELLATLASPKKPSSLSYKDAVDLLQAHLQPKPSILAERYRFRQRRQMPGEAIAEYIADLKKMSRYCEFKTSLEENLRDQFVCGLRSEFIRQRLFAEDSLDYRKALTLANTLEAAERDAGAVEVSREQVSERELGENIHKLGFKKCSACGDDSHQKYNCRYREFECSYCRKVGHLRRACLKKEHDQRFSNSNVNGSWGRANRGREVGPSRGVGARRGGGAGRGARGHSRAISERASDAAGAAYWLSEPAGPAEDSVEGGDVYEDDDDQAMYQMSLTNYKPVCMTLTVNNKLLNMEVDTGSAISCISKTTYIDQFKDLKLKPCTLKLKFYDGSVIQPIGYLETYVKYKNNIKKLDLYVIIRISDILL